MARFGTWAPLSANWASQSRMTQVDIISLHTMVGSLTGTDGMFRRNGFGGTFSHFGVGGNGECTQWQDTAYRAAANYNGNWHIISVECADLGAPFAAWNTSDGSAVPAFTGPQCETLSQLIATMCKAHNIPCAIIPDAKPGRRGIGWHRMGVPGYMVAGAEQWSTAQGKVCPGNRRIAQIPGIVARAQQILGGASATASIQEDDMPLSIDDLKKIREYVWRDPGPDAMVPRDILLDVQAALRMPIHSTVTGSDVALTPRDMLASVDNNAWTTAQQMAALVASNNAIADAIRNNVGNNVGITTEQAIAAGQAGADAALKQLGQELAN